ncbi:MAG: hypothetical protein WAO55_12925 [Candidatus Manganitrophaceae bacterium]
MTQNKRLLWLFLTLFFLTTALPSAWAVKPLPPVQLSIKQTGRTDHRHQVTMTATANIDLDKIELSLELPPGVSRIEGEETWKGAMKKGETKKVSWTLQSRDQTPQTIFGKAITHLNEGNAFLQKALLTLNETAADAPRAAPSVKRKEGTETILEFKGK